MILFPGKEEYLYKKQCRHPMTDMTDKNLRTVSTNEDYTTRTFRRFQNVSNR